MEKLLKCPACNSHLKLVVAFSGCDWETEAGEGSGYDYPLSLDCTNRRCARTFTLGHLKDYGSFSQIKDHKPYITE